MDEFGYEEGINVNDNNTSTNENADNNVTENVTDLNGDYEKDDITQTSGDSEKNKKSDNSNVDDNQHDDENVKYEVGTVLEIGDSKYTIDANGNAIDSNGNLFKKVDEIKDWLSSFEEVEDKNDEISLTSIQEMLGIDIKDENDKTIEFENTPAGINSYINAVIDSKRNEHYDIAINSLFNKYPILQDVLNYYLANNNSLDGFNERPDRSNITIDENNEAQQIHIIKTAWKEQGRRGNVDSYIDYLKASGILFVTAKEELAALQEADLEYKKQLEEDAERNENEQIEKTKQYWNYVYDVVKSRNIAGYQIPETMIVNRNGQKISATPEDFFNYIYRVDKDGVSAYQRDLATVNPEDSIKDDILRAYLKFVGGTYSNLVDMAINKEKINTLKFKAAQKTNNKVKISKPKSSTKNKEIDFGY